MTSPNSPQASRRPLTLVRAGMFSLCVAISLFCTNRAYSAEEARRAFDVRPEAADRSLKRFSEQAGVEVLFPTEVARVVKTNEVKGQFTVQEAIERMLANTGLVAVQDPKTKALLIKRGSEVPNVGRTAPTVVQERRAEEASTGEEVLQLSPFEVDGSSDRGYSASSALGGTRTNEKLSDLPNSISVFTSDLMNDLAINDFFGAVEFGVGTANVYNDSGVIGAPVGASASNQVNFRGIASLRQLRDGFVWFVPQDNFNIERIEFVRGPNGTAYGDVDPSGTLNMSTKRAQFSRSGKVIYRADNFGSRRYQADFNIPLTPQVALRLNAVNTGNEQWRENADTMTRAGAGSLRIKPFKDSRTQLDISFEGGSYRRNLASLRLNDGTVAYVRGSGTNALDANPNLSGNQANGVGMRRVLASTNAGHVFFNIGGTLYDMRSTSKTVFRTSTVLTSTGVASGSDPQNPLRLPLLPTSSDIYSEGQDWGGPSNHLYTKYGVLNVEFTHKLTEHLRVLVSHNSQYNNSETLTMFSGASVAGMNSRTVFIDVNRVLPDPTVAGATIPNPRFEKYFVAHVPVRSDNGSKANGWGTSFVHDAKLPFWSASLRTVAGATYRHEQNYNDSFRYALTKAEMARRGITGTSATYPNNAVNIIHYLEDGSSNDTLLLPENRDVADFYRQGTSQTRYDQTLASANIASIGSFFNDRLHTSLGLTRYYFRQNRSLAPITDAFGESQMVDASGAYITNPGRWDVPVYKFKRDYATNKSAGAVLKVLSWFALSAGRFESALFTESTASEITGKPVKARTGKGNEYSARFNFLDDRINATITRFETVSQNNVISLSSDAVTELNALLPTSSQLTGTGDYRDDESKGWEAEVQTNLSKNWTLRGTYSTSNVLYTNFYPLVRPYLALASSEALSQGLNSDEATTITRQLIADTEGAVSKVRKETASIVTRYDITEGRLKGFSFGVSTRYELGHKLPAVIVDQVEVLQASRTASNVIWNPFAYYRRKIWDYKTTFQLNVNNVFDRRTNQGNSYTWVRTNERRQYVGSITVSF